MLSKFANTLLFTSSLFVWFMFFQAKSAEQRKLNLDIN